MSQTLSDDITQTMYNKIPTNEIHNNKKKSSNNYHALLLIKVILLDLSLPLLHNLSTINFQTKNFLPYYA